MNSEPTAHASYAEYLQRSWWKRMLRPADPYLRRMRRRQLGRTLDVGCGVGRNLAVLPAGSVGVDHNADSVHHARSLGLDALTVEEFKERAYPTESFDSVLLAHVLEHMDEDTGRALVASYLPYLRPGGSVVLICPQERGYTSDPTHVRWTTDVDLVALCEGLGLERPSSTSFPLPRWAGKRFTYNEFWVAARKS